MRLIPTLILASALLLTQAAPAALGQQPAGGAQGAADTSGLGEAARLSSEVVRLHREKKFAEAQPLAERALALRERSLGGEHPLVGGALVNLAAVLVAREKYQQAEDLYRRAAAVFEKAGENLLLADARRQLGTLLARRGKHAEAIPLLESVVALGEKGPAEGRESLADALNMLTQLHLVRGDVEKAAPAWHRALTLWREMYGREDPRVEAAEDSMACFLVRAVGHTKSLEFRSKLYELEAASSNVKAAAIFKGKALKKPQPSYPEAALAQRVSGVVVVRLVVDETGKVVKAKAICGPPVLGPASEEAARGALFEPTLLNGRPVKVTGVITYNFVIR